MTPENDQILTDVTVRLEDIDTGTPIGSGTIFCPNNAGANFYIITAAHCLFYDSDKFLEPRERVAIAIFNQDTRSYVNVAVDVNIKLSGVGYNRDIAILTVGKERVENIVRTLPQIRFIKERNTQTSFILKGFPSATKGMELVTTRPVYNQDLPAKNVFQLLLTDDFTTSTNASPKVEGFSGSGIFIEDHNQIYYYGVFTRFRDAQKIIYCEYTDILNEILEANFLEPISYSYIGEYGLTSEFFEQHNHLSIKNLGPRFNEKLNLKLPVANLFEIVARNSRFKRMIVGAIDKWLSNRIHSDYPETIELSEALVKIKSEMLMWLEQLSWEPINRIDVSTFIVKIEALNKGIRGKISQLYQLRRDMKEKDTDSKKNNRASHKPEFFEYEIHSLRDMEDHNSDILSFLSSVNFQLANFPILIIKGEPGCGKSHLLGDVANIAISKRKARILLLGQLFRLGKSIWQNICDQVAVNCTKDQLLTSLNNIGRQQGERVLIMIDALNEGPGKELWKDELAGFIEEILKYPWIGLVLTVRSTYYNSIISKEIQGDARISQEVHIGFKGNEYVALRLFCEHYSLTTPTFPILSPEFTNPLLLQIICQGIRSSGLSDFPQGFQGITSIFNYYVDALYEKLIDKRDIYRNRKHIIREAIIAFANSCFEKKGGRILSLVEADELFYQKFGRFPDMMNDFINENVLIQNEIRNGSDGASEFIYFSYERFGDYFIAEQLLKELKDRVAVFEAFRKENKLGQLLLKFDWRSQGVLEALSVILPEKYGLELFEVYEWITHSSDNVHKYRISSLGGILWNSLKWRAASSIHYEKIVDWLIAHPRAITNHDWLNGLFELCTVHDHPFNGDRLFLSLCKHSMPKRDSVWQKFTRYYSGRDDNSNAYPLNRLLEWCWTPEISNMADPETVRLAGQSLVWLLSCTDRKLRDQATKALVNLLEQQPDTLIKILTAFQEIDDPYITERLYAVAYGCALRTNDIKGLKMISNHVFDVIFSKGMPPIHVLLRDYARNIIEYAHSLGVANHVDLNLIRPPYSSMFPRFLPSEEEIRVYETDILDDDPEHIKDSKRIKGKIHFSILHWDFGKYTVNNAVSGFGAVNFTIGKAFSEFKRKLKRGQRDKLAVADKILECLVLLEDKKEEGVKVIADSPIEDWIIKACSEFNDFVKILEKDLLADHKKDLHELYIPYLITKYKKIDYFSEPANRVGIKRWIVQRAYQLGFDMELHGDFDSTVERYSDYGNNNSIERIGKKYQWIALHEMVAMLGDNFYFTEDRWSSDRKFGIFQGPWQQFLRDIDPIYTTPNQEYEDDEGDVMSDPAGSSDFGWWFNSSYSYWNQPVSAWIENKIDLPEPSKIINKQDVNGVDWIYLKLNCNWKEPKTLGQDRYGSFKKEIIYMINSYIIRKKDKKKLVNWLGKKNFFGRWMPESRSSPIGLCNRENYWSPASKWNLKDYKVWESIDGISSKAIVTVHDAVGEMSDDSSNARMMFYMPCKFIFDGMGLFYAAEDGAFKNEKGEIIAKNFMSKGIMIRQKDFLDFLEKEDLDIVWTLLGEKNSYFGMGGSNNLFRAISGVYYLDNKKLAGNLKITKRN